MDFDLTPTSERSRRWRASSPKGRSSRTRPTGIASTASRTSSSRSSPSSGSSASRSRGVRRRGPTRSYALVMEEIARACARRRHHGRAHSSLTLRSALRHRRAEEGFLPPLARGKKLGCFALTEPGAAPMPARCGTSATANGDGWVLNGAKNWITNGPHAGTSSSSRSTDRPTRHARHHALPRRRATCRASPAASPTRSSASTPRTRHRVLRELRRCPTALLLGGEGDGFKVAMATLDGGRIGIASQALGIARAALERRVAYAKERKASAVRSPNSRRSSSCSPTWRPSSTPRASSRWRAASMKDQGVRHSRRERRGQALRLARWRRASPTRRSRSTAATATSTEFAVERHYRDARITEIYEGTSEIQRIVIARSILGRQLREEPAAPQGFHS